MLLYLSKVALTLALVLGFERRHHWMECKVFFWLCVCY